MKFVECWKQFAVLGFIFDILFPLILILIEIGSLVWSQEWPRTPDPALSTSKHLAL